MKRMILFLFAIGVAAMGRVSMAAMSNSRVRKETRFLTDKMAYELSLSPGQYNDAYEINYDFIHAVRYLMDDVIRGEEWAMDRYYHALDVRNDDLRWVLNASQYRRFLRTDYFYRPVYASGGRWNFRIYIAYTNHNHFYFDKPYHYNSYRGGHCRLRYDSPSHYRGRYKHEFYSGSRRTSTSLRREADKDFDRRTKRDRHAVRRSDHTQRKAHTTAPSVKRENSKRRER